MEDPGTGIAGERVRRTVITDGRSGGWITAATAVVAIAVVLIACSPPQPLRATAQEKPAGGTNGKEAHVNGLLLGTFPKETTFLPGESLPVETVLENTGATPIEVTNPEDPSPFRYELLRQVDRQVVITLSEIMRDARRTRDISPETFHPPVPLQPRQRTSRNEDLADFLNQDIPPGKYLLRARYPFDEPTIESALAPFTVLSPNYESFSSAVCERLELLTTVFAHRRTDGGVLILQRDSLPDPRENVFFERIKLGPGPPVSVATAIDAVNAGSGRWFAWLQGGVFQAAVGWGNRLITKSAPLTAGSPNAHLISPGFQIGVGVGMFGVLDSRGGKMILRAIRAEAQGLKELWQGELGSDAATEVRWNYRPDKETTVVWRDPSTGLLYRARFDPGGKVLEAPGVVTRVPAVAWDLSALGEPTIRFIGQDAKKNYRYAVIKAGPLEPPKEMPALQGVTAWGFCAAGDEVKVVAQAAGRVWATAPQRHGWDAIAEVKDSAYLHAFAPRGRTCWAEWVERGIGIRRVALGDEGAAK